MISVLGRFSKSIARAVTQRAKVESSPPEIPTTAVLARECSRRFFKPRDWMDNIVSQRFFRALCSDGINGLGSMILVRLVFSTGREK